MAYHTTRMFIKVKDDSTWNKFREAMQAEKLENTPPKFREFLSAFRTKRDQFVMTGWVAAVYDAYKFAVSLTDVAPEEFMLLSDTDCSIDEGNGACWYFGYDTVQGGEPIIVNYRDYKLNEDYLVYDVSDFRGKNHPAMMIHFMVNIDDPVDWIRYGIGTGMIELEEEDAAFLKEMGYEIDPVNPSASNQTEPAEKEMGFKERSVAEWKEIFKIFYLYDEGAVISGYKGAYTEVTIPAKIGKKPVVEICKDTFKSNKKITGLYIEPGVKRIGDNAFGGCKKLKSITLPDSIIRVGDYAFDKTAYMNDEANWDGDVLYIGKCLIKAKDTLKGVYTIKEGTKVIASHAFVGPLTDFSGLTGVIIPDSVVGIGSMAFSCCSGLTNITLPANLSYIGTFAFSGTGLTNISIPNGVTSIEAWAFSECNELESITIPSSVTSIEESVFESCPKLTIHAPSGSCAEQYAKEYNIPFEATIIPERQELKKAEQTADSSVHKNQSESDKTDQAKVKKQATEHKPEDGITGLVFIVSDVLNHWKSQKDLKAYLALYDAKLGSGVTKKTDYLVTNYPDDKAEKTIKAKELGIPIIDEEEFNYMIGRFYRDSENIVVPSWVKYLPEKAFAGCEKVKSITVPDSVMRINKNAFDGCKKVAFHISDTAANRLEYFEVNRGELRKYHGPGGDVIIPDEVTGIGMWAFSGCTGLMSITIGNGVSGIERDAFEKCTNLASVTFGSGVEFLGSGAFSGCVSLTSITLPDSMTEIGPWAFSGCKKLKSVSIPGSVTQIAKTAFDSNSKLTIHAPAGSCAEKYAKKYKISFEAE